MVIVPLTGPENATIHTDSAIRARVIINKGHIIRMHNQIRALIGLKELKIVTSNPKENI